MTLLNSLRISILLATPCLAQPGANSPATFRVVAYGYNMGSPGGLVEMKPGLFYAVATVPIEGVFSVTTPNGDLKTVATLPINHNIFSDLIVGPNSLAYSTQQLNGVNGGPPEVFSIGVGKPLTIYTGQKVEAFFSQNLPSGKILGVALNLNTSPWYLVESDLGGNISVRYQFPADEILPQVATYGSDGDYYGVSTLKDGSGYVYQLTPTGKLTKLTTFPTNSFGSSHLVGLLEANDGNLYGTTPNGGANAKGTIYKLTKQGEYTLLYTFPHDYNSIPLTLLEASDGNLYGSTLGQPPFNGHSELFRITKTGQYTLLYAMKNLGFDGACECTMVQGSDGIIYGTAALGGLNSAGEVFALDAGLPKPAPTGQFFYPTSGAPGSRVLIWGHNLLSSSVTFNGVAATDATNSGSNYVWATVPPGASSGPITITTPGGAHTTSASFTINQGSSSVLVQKN